MNLNLPIFTHLAGCHNLLIAGMAGGFLGACALTPQMDAYQAYEDATMYVQNQTYEDASVINSSIISAVRGHYGDYHLTEKTRDSRLWISPLMPVYWFFDLASVARHNLYLSQLEGTETFMETVQMYRLSAMHISKRADDHVPL